MLANTSAQKTDIPPLVTFLSVIKYQEMKPFTKEFIVVVVLEGESILSRKHGIKPQAWQQKQGAEILHLGLQICSRRN